MEKNGDGRAFNQGRPKISDLEKKRRRVRRQDERYREMRAELEAKGWERRVEHEGPGRPKKLRQDKVRDQLIKLRKMVHELRSYEREAGERRVPLTEIRDPLIDNKTLHAVGRRPADELTEIDYKIRKTITRMAELTEEIDKHQSIFPEKPKLGRTPVNRLEKLEYQHDKLRQLILRMLDIEDSLNNTQLISRQIKMFFDEAREARKKAKQADKDAVRRYYENRNESLYKEINRMKEYLREDKFPLSNLDVNVGVKRIKIKRPFDLELTQAHKEVQRLKDKYFCD